MAWKSYDWDFKNIARRSPEMTKKIILGYFSVLSKTSYKKIFIVISGLLLAMFLNSEPYNFDAMVHKGI